MATEMSPKDLEAAKIGAVVIAEADIGNIDDGDDVSMHLLKTTGGRHVRLIVRSGFNSEHVGAGDIGYLLDETEVADWVNAVG